jgi:hypothetical protein
VVRVSHYVEKVDIDVDGDDVRGHRRKLVDSQIRSVPPLPVTLLILQKAIKEMRATRGQPKLVQAAGMH